MMVRIGEIIPKRPNECGLGNMMLYPMTDPNGAAMVCHGSHSQKPQSC